MSSKEYKENVPNIVVNDDIIDERYIGQLAKMMGVNNEEVLKVLGIIFSKLGYTEDDKIGISKVVRSAYDVVGLEFEVNGQYVFKTLFHRRYGRDCLGFALTDNNKNHYMYRCDISKISDNDFDVKMLLKGSEIGQGRDLIICKRDYDNVKYSFFSPASDMGLIKQVIGLEIFCSEEEKNKNKNNREYFAIKNEKALIEYLSKCTYPVNIGEVFETIREMSFAGDLRDFPLFHLNVLTVINSKSDEGREFTDRISIRNGQLNRICFSHIGRFDDCENNFGGVVQFVPSGIMYSVLNFPHGWENLGFIDDDNDSRVSQSFVYNSAKEVARLFPIDAKKFLGRYYIDEVAVDCDQMSFFDEKPKQYSKVDDSKKNGDN